jgi:hypothetical protein
MHRAGGVWITNICLCLKEEKDLAFLKLSSQLRDFSIITFFTLEYKDGGMVEECVDESDRRKFVSYL